jgi:hypothetical protein
VNADEFDEWIRQQRAQRGLGDEESPEEMAAQLQKQWRDERQNFHPFPPINGSFGGWGFEGRAYHEPVPHIPFINWAQLRQKPVPQLQFAVDDLLVHRTAFLLGGDSGSGKSILAQTWCTCMAAGSFFLGRKVRPCIAAYFTGEDDIDMLYLRQERIRRALRISERDLDDRLYLASVVDRDTWLYSSGRPTALADELEKQLADMKAGFAIIDSASLTFDDDEIRRRPVAGFMRNIAAMGRRLDASVGLIAHTSRSSKADAKRMVSGSTAWVAQARAGFLLEPGEEEGSTEVKVSLIAPNYTKRGQTFELEWTEDGVLLPKAADAINSIAVRATDKTVLEEITKRWLDPSAEPLSKAPSTGDRYLPLYLQRTRQVRPKDALASLTRLLDAGDVLVAAKKFGAGRKPANGLCPATPRNAP